MNKAEYLLKRANAELSRRAYTKALDGYVNIILNLRGSSVLAKQAAFNLQLIPKILRREGEKSIRVTESVGRRHLNSVGLPEFDGTISSVQGLLDLAASYPAVRVILESSGASSLIFSLFHQLFWQSDIELPERERNVTSHVRSQHLFKVLGGRPYRIKSLEEGRNYGRWPDISNPFMSQLQEYFEELSGLSHALTDIISNRASERAEFKILCKDDFKRLNQRKEDPRETGIALPERGEIPVKFRKERFANGTFKGWLAMPTIEALKSAKVHLVVKGKVVRTARVANDRPDVQKMVNQPAGEVHLSMPKEFFDGHAHTVEVVLTTAHASAVLAIELFCDRSAWAKYADLAKTEGKKVVLFASHNLKIQGAQTSLYQTIVGLARSANIYPVVFSPTNGPMKKAYERQGIPVVVQGYPRVHASSEKVWLSELSYFISCVRTLSPDVVLANTLQSFHSAIAALALDIPTILVPRESEDPRTYFNDLPAYMRIYADSLVSCVDRSVFVARATRELWRFADTGNQAVIYNGLELGELERKLGGITREGSRVMMGISRDEKVVLSVGTVCERKGQLDVVRSLPVLAHALGEAPRVFIVGMTDNNYSKSLVSAVAELPRGVQRKVHLLPHTEDANDSLVQLLFRASDVFVMSSVHESYPRVVLEALYFSLPVVATRCFGVVEQIKDGQSGVFYEAGRYRDLADKLYGVISRQSRLKTFREEAYKQFENLTTYEDMVSQYKRLILDLMEK